MQPIMRSTLIKYSIPIMPHAIDSNNKENKRQEKFSHIPLFMHIKLEAARENSLS
jgi:hypothetical protein